MAPIISGVVAPIIPGVEDNADSTDNGALKKEIIYTKYAYG